MNPPMTADEIALLVECVEALDAAGYVGLSNRLDRVMAGWETVPRQPKYAR